VLMFQLGAAADARPVRPIAWCLETHSGEAHLLHLPETGP
jgi:hypothetical protein